MPCKIIYTQIYNQGTWHLTPGYKLGHLTPDSKRSNFADTNSCSGIQHTKKKININLSPKTPRNTCARRARVCVAMANWCSVVFSVPQNRRKSTHFTFYRIVVGRRCLSSQWGSFIGGTSKHNLRHHRVASH